MTEENTAQFLGRREQELIARIKALKGQLGPLEAELAQVQSMRAMLPGEKHNASLASVDFLSAVLNSAPTGMLASPSSSALNLAPSKPQLAPYQDMTIKELTVQALLDGFPNGATPGQIFQFIIQAYSRDIEMPSFRTQMHRLKNAGILEVDGETWRLSKNARRDFDMYDHPSSRRSNKDLQDDP